MVPAAGADCVGWIWRTRLSGARVERRLAAILAAGIAGCSRLMSEDDAGTLARVAGVVHAMCDVSDELLAGLGHSCGASGRQPF
jgi:class 3 adenylate cyclase